MTTLHFAQISDIHLSALGDHHDMLSGHADEFLRTAVTHLNGLPDLDFVLLTGDLLDTATIPELDRFWQIIANLNRPYYVIPGNHDRRNPDSPAGMDRHEFARLFNPQVAARPSAPELQAGYWSLTVRPEVQLIGLDSIVDKDWAGLIDAPQVEWLKAELAAHAGKQVILLVHHPFHRLAPIDTHPDWTRFVCENGPEMMALLDNYPQVGLVLTGHHHLTKVDRLGRRLHLAGPALAGYPCAYRTLRLARTASTWRLDWQTHPAAGEATVAEARRRMIDAWTEAGFSLNFIEDYARLALGSDYDRTGSAELPPA